MVCVPADLTSPDAPTPPDPRPPGGARLRAAARRVSAPAIHPTQASLRGFALASVVANAGIVATGAAVRLSNSGLGCLDWPTCTKTSLAAAPRVGEPVIHTWIEFGNRTLTGVLEVIAVLVFVAALRYRPPGSQRRRGDLVWLAAIQPFAILVQAVIGGIVVLTDLNPAWVSGHFMVSVLVLAAAVTLHVRCGEEAGPVRALVRSELRWLGTGMVAVVFAMLTAGTVVTGTGPLAGAAGVPRYHFSLVSVTQLHADIGWLMGGVTFALVLGLRLTGAPERITRLGYLLLAMMAAQGTIGYIQYFSHLPAGLVWVHESASVLIWIVTLRLWFAMRTHDPVPQSPEGAEAGPLPGHALAR
jgi:cytochrome c oxidase assembly protein subunit 15